MTEARAREAVDARLALAAVAAWLAVYVTVHDAGGDGRGRNKFGRWCDCV